MPQSDRHRARIAPGRAGRRGRQRTHRRLGRQSRLCASCSPHRHARRRHRTPDECQQKLRGQLSGQPLHGDPCRRGPVIAQPAVGSAREKAQSAADPEPTAPDGDPTSLRLGDIPTQAARRMKRHGATGPRRARRAGPGRSPGGAGSPPGRRRHVARRGHGRFGGSAARVPTSVSAGEGERLWSKNGAVRGPRAGHQPERVNVTIRFTCDDEAHARRPAQRRR